MCDHHRGIYIDPRGYAQCRECNRIRAMEWRIKNPQRVVSNNQRYYYEVTKCES